MEKSTTEKFWVIAVRVIALFIGFLPFLPNAMFYLGLKDKELPISMSMLFNVVIGFVMLWGSANFGTWANALGKGIVEKIKKK